MQHKISATDPDWSRETPRRWWDPSRKFLKALRRYQRASKGPLSKLRRRRWVMSHRFWSVITQVDIPLNTAIGGGMLFPHPNGIVIHPNAKIGPNCLIFQQVTIGTRGGRPGAPVIGANAVVVQDVPPHATAVGIPARIQAPRAPAPAAPDVEALEVSS